MSATVKGEPQTQEVPDLETIIAKAKRAFALKQYEQAVTLYATALENYAADCTPATVDIYYLYGCALLENAIISNNVLGNKAEGEEEPEQPEPAVKDEAKGRFFFGADGEEDQAVDLFAQAQAAEQEEEAPEKEEAEENEEPEDDFEAAWDILDLARSTYDTMQGDDSQLKLAAAYVALADISLETEKFDQAILDYNAALEIKVKLLPLENRQIAEAHFRLSMAYDMTSGKLENQIEHVEKALESLKKRGEILKELLPKAPETKPSAADSDAKGKGKATTVQENPLGWTPKIESLESMTKSEIEAEIKDVTSLSEELQMKLEDIRATPADGVGGTTMDRVGRELDQELKNSGFGAPLAADQPVNDLSSMVKKKKPKPAATAVNPLVPNAPVFNPLVPDAKPVNPLVPDATSLPSLGKRKAEEDPDRDEKKKRVE